MTDPSKRPLVSEEDPAGETARGLIAALCQEMSGRYGRPPSPFSPNEGGGERSVFLVVRLGREPVACGALRRFDEETAEIKRMYVVPRARGLGIGRMLLAELEYRAIGFVYRKILLETGVLQPEAQRLYASAGFKRIPPFGPYIGNPTSVCYGRDLGGDPGPTFGRLIAKSNPN